MLYAFIAVAIFSWFIDKMVQPPKLVDSDNKEITEVKNRFFPKELGFVRALDRRIPWRSDRNHTIGDRDPSNPKPFIDIPELKRKLTTSDGKQDYILPDAKEKAYRLIHERFNLEEHHRFDQDIGGKYIKMTPWRQSRVAAFHE